MYFGLLFSLLKTKLAFSGQKCSLSQAPLLPSVTFWHPVISPRCSITIPWPQPGWHSQKCLPSITNAKSQNRLFGIWNPQGKSSRTNVIANLNFFFCSQKALLIGTSQSLRKIGNTLHGHLPKERYWWHHSQSSMKEQEAVLHCVSSGCPMETHLVCWCAHVQQCSQLEL